METTTRFNVKTFTDAQENVRKILILLVFASLAKSLASLPNKNTLLNREHSTCCTFRTEIHLNDMFFWVHWKILTNQMSPVEGRGQS